MTCVSRSRYQGGVCSLETSGKLVPNPHSIAGAAPDLSVLYVSSQATCRGACGDGLIWHIAVILVILVAAGRVGVGWLLGRRRTGVPHRQRDGGPDLRRARCVAEGACGRAEEARSLHHGILRCGTIPAGGGKQSPGRPAGCVRHAARDRAGQRPDRPAHPDSDLGPVSTREPATERVRAGSIRRRVQGHLRAGAAVTELERSQRLLGSQPLLSSARQS